jgi:hypothetical protein
MKEFCEASPDQFVELRLDSGAVAIWMRKTTRKVTIVVPLIDDEFPRVGEAEERSACGPNDDNSRSKRLSANLPLAQRGSKRQ